eukprot:3098652-Pyramimonas_sp.AAC.1
MASALGVCPQPTSITGQLQQVRIRAGVFQPSEIRSDSCRVPHSTTDGLPLFLDYHAQVTGNPRVGTQPENPHGWATADDFYQSQLTRGSGYTSSVLGQIPLYGYLATPTDSDVTQQSPGLVAPSSMGEVRPE